MILFILFNFLSVYYFYWRAIPFLTLIFVGSSQLFLLLIGIARIHWWNTNSAVGMGDYAFSNYLFNHQKLLSYSLQSFSFRCYVLHLYCHSVVLLSVHILYQSLLLFLFPLPFLPFLLGFFIIFLIRDSFILFHIYFYPPPDSPSQSEPQSPAPSPSPSSSSSTHSYRINWMKYYLVLFLCSMVFIFMYIYYYLFHTNGFLDIIHSHFSHFNGLSSDDSPSSTILPLTAAEFADSEKNNHGYYKHNVFWWILSNYLLYFLGNLIFYSTFNEADSKTSGDFILYDKYNGFGKGILRGFSKDITVKQLLLFSIILSLFDILYYHTPFRFSLFIHSTCLLFILMFLNHSTTSPIPPSPSSSSSVKGNAWKIILERREIRLVIFGNIILVLSTILNYIDFRRSQYIVEYLFSSLSSFLLFIDFYSIILLLISLFYFYSYLKYKYQISNISSPSSSKLPSTPSTEKHSREGEGEGEEEEEGEAKEEGVKEQKGEGEDRKERNGNSEVIVYEILSFTLLFLFSLKFQYYSILSYLPIIGFILILSTLRGEFLFSSVIVRSEGGAKSSTSSLISTKKQSSIEHSRKLLQVFLLGFMGINELIYVSLEYFHASGSSLLGLPNTLNELILYFILNSYLFYLFLNILDILANLYQYKIVKLYYCINKFLLEFSMYFLILYLSGGSNKMENLFNFSICIFTISYAINNSLNESLKNSILPQDFYKNENHDELIQTLKLNEKQENIKNSEKLRIYFCNKNNSLIFVDFKNYYFMFQIKISEIVKKMSENLFKFGSYIWITFIVLKLIFSIPAGSISENLCFFVNFIFGKNLLKNLLFSGSFLLFVGCLLRFYSKLNFNFFLQYKKFVSERFGARTDIQGRIYSFFDFIAFQDNIFGDDLELKASFLRLFVILQLLMDFISILANFQWLFLFFRVFGFFHSFALYSFYYNGYLSSLLNSRPSRLLLVFLEIIFYFFIEFLLLGFTGSLNFSPFVQFLSEGFTCMVFVLFLKNYFFLNEYSVPFHSSSILFTVFFSLFGVLLILLSSIQFYSFFGNFVFFSGLFLVYLNYYFAWKIRRTSHPSSSPSPSPSPSPQPSSTSNNGGNQWHVNHSRTFQLQVRFICTFLSCFLILFSNLLNSKLMYFSGLLSLIFRQVSGLFKYGFSNSLQIDQNEKVSISFGSAISLLLVAAAIQDFLAIFIASILLLFSVLHLFIQQRKHLSDKFPIYLCAFGVSFLLLAAQYELLLSFFPSLSFYSDFNLFANYSKLTFAFYLESVINATRYWVTDNFLTL